MAAAPPPTTDQLLCMLLGHREGGGEAVARWLRGAEMKRGGTSYRSTVEEAELGSANLWDERLELAEKRFGAVLLGANMETGRPEHAGFLDVLARIGIGACENTRKRFDSAAERLMDARRRAERLGDDRLVRASSWYWALNASDSGQPTDELRDMLDPGVSDHPLQTVDFVLDCQRALVLAKLLYRASDREGSLVALAHVMENELFVQLSPIVQGTLLRFRGITHTARHDRGAARADLTAALRLFEQAGYVPGQVRATQSLARSNLFLNVFEAETQLHAARATLAADKDGAYPRYSVTAQSDLESRIGELHLLQGRPDKALEHFVRDRDITLEQGAPTRAMAYVDYNVGRALLALGRLHAALESLERSAAAFAKVGDPFNELRSRIKLIEGLLETRDGGDSAREQLDWAEQQYQRLPDLDRSRLPANLLVLRARADLQAHGDVVQARARLQQALNLLAPAGKGAEFIRATIALGEAHQYAGDQAGARRLLDQSVRLAEAAEMPDLKQLAIRFGADPTGGSAEEPDELQRECRDSIVEKQLTILVVMLQGYSEFSHVFGLPQLGQMLADFSKRMAGSVELHDGQLLRFDGDTLTAVFCHKDLPLSPEVLAVQSALQMCQRFSYLQRGWERRSQRPLRERLPDLRLRVGIATGPTIAGHFGIRSRRAFAVLGPNVNQSFQLVRGGPDGRVTVCQRTARVLTDRWPGLTLEPVEIASSTVRGVRAFAIDPNGFYPSPKSSSGNSVPPPA